MLQDGLGENPQYWISSASDSLYERPRKTTGLLDKYRGVGGVQSPALKVGSFVAVTGY
jgi:hypothetical protein